jgi:ABC-2 type transport system ATP-binding protein
MGSLIRIEGLRVVFSDDWGKNRLTALDGLSFDVKSGQVLGVMGSNGSGKSTLLKVLCGLLVDAEGEIKISGLSPGRAVGKKLIGYLPERPSFPGYLTPTKFLQQMARLSGYSPENTNIQVESCLNSCELSRLQIVKRLSPAIGFSTGNHS